MQNLDSLSVSTVFDLTGVLSQVVNMTESLLGRQLEPLAVCV